MVSVIVFLLVLMALAGVILVIVAVGGGSAANRSGDADIAARIVAHLNGDAEPPPTLVSMYDDLPAFATRSADEVEPISPEPQSDPQRPEPALGDDDQLRRATRAWELSVRRRASLLVAAPERGSVRQRRARDQARDRLLARKSLH